MRPVTTTLLAEAAVVSAPARRLLAGGSSEVIDRLAVEAPLELRFDGRPFTVVMRTPGHDFELALGFLFSEGIVISRAEVLALGRPPQLLADDCQNVVEITLDAARERPTIERTFYASASCGVCGKASIEQLEVKAAKVTSDFSVDRTLLEAFPERLRGEQPAFAATGGLHAAALVAGDGTLLAVREDVGRHNAVDKLIGWALEQGRVPLSDVLLFVSGRLGFEIVQKAIVAGVPLIGSVGAASSLAVDLAKSFGLTLATFVRPGSMNLFGDPGRVTAQAAVVAPRAESP